MTDLNEARIEVVRRHMALEITHDWDGVLATFEHPRYELMGPGTIGMAATQINVFVNTVLATGQGTGAVSWLDYAFRLMYLPIGLFGVSEILLTLDEKVPVVPKAPMSSSGAGVSGRRVSLHPQSAQRGAAAVSGAQPSQPRPGATDRYPAGY